MGQIESVHGARGKMRPLTVAGGGQARRQAEGREENKMCRKKCETRALELSRGFWQDGGGKIRGRGGPGKGQRPECEADCRTLKNAKKKII